MDHKFIREGAAVLNTDNGALQAYKRRKNAMRVKDQQIQDLTERLNKLEEMLTTVLKQNGN